jgi:hypothetical protein
VWLIVVGGLALLWWASRQTASAQTTFDMSETPGRTYSQQIRQFARAIASAEGFGVTNAVPTRAHNPGDLKVPGWTGPTTGAEDISIFADDAEGWERLHHQLQLIVDGRSHVYTLDMTIAEMGDRWTATAQPEWTANVVDWLNTYGDVTVTIETPLRDVLA